MQLNVSLHYNDNKAHYNIHESKKLSRVQVTGTLSQWRIESFTAFLWFLGVFVLWEPAKRTFTWFKKWLLVKVQWCCCIMKFNIQAEVNQSLMHVLCTKHPMLLWAVEISLSETFTALWNSSLQTVPSAQAWTERTVTHSIDFQLHNKKQGLNKTELWLIWNHPTISRHWSHHVCAVPCQVSSCGSTYTHTQTHTGPSDPFPLQPSESC